jgi:hypothetical protein
MLPRTSTEAPQVVVRSPGDKGRGSIVAGVAGVGGVCSAILGVSLAAIVGAIPEYRRQADVLNSDVTWNRTPSDNEVVRRL